MKNFGHRRGVVRLAYATFVLAVTLAVNADAQTLPPGWTATDIGAPPLTGSTQYASGTYTLEGAGEIGVQPSGATDQFRFVYRQMTGDIDIRARVTSIENTNQWSKAGVMVRETLASNSVMGLAFISGGRVSAFQWRSTTGARRQHADGPAVTVPHWVRLVRIGSLVTSSRSSDGVTWATISTMTLSAPTLYVGLAVTSATVTSLATGVFDNVVVGGPPTNNQAPTVTMTAPAIGAPFVAPASIGLAAAASDTDGTIAQVTFFNGATLLTTVTSAPYAFTWNGVAAGSYSVTAVAQDNAGATTTSAARTVTVTAPLPNPPPVVTLTGPANGAVYTAPALIPITADASDVNGTVTVVEFYNGSTMIGSDTTAPYALSWTNVAAGTYSLTALARDNAGATSSTTALTVTVSSGGALPAGWTASDVGAPALTGTTQYASGTYTLEGAGEIGPLAIDQFRFVYRQMTGDIDIRARVMSIENTNQWSKAGVMVRETLATNSMMGITFISGGSVSAFQRRITTGGSRQHVDGPAVTVPRWVRLERRGSLVTSSQSSDGVTWATISTMTLSAPTLYVGLAVASATVSTLATGVFDNVVVEVPTTNNQAPTVTMTAPAIGAPFVAPASIGLAATASDTDGTITQVTFFNGATALSTDTSAPYAFTWNGVAAGSYSVTAVAQDNAGATTTSAARTVTVTAPLPNPPPVVTLTGPANGTGYTAPALIPITADASDANGTVTVVEFYNGATMIGLDTTAPYALSWTNVAAGTYSLTALARDNAGAPATSAALTVTVSSGGALPAGWTASDVGAPALTGTTQYASGTYTLEGAGEIGPLAIDQFRFVYRQITGDIDIRARVMSIENTNQWSKAGVMVRETLATNSMMGITFISGGSVSAFQRRITTGGSRQHVDGPAVTVPRWVRLERRGSLVTSSQSSDGVTWATISTMTLSAPTLYVGLAVASATVSTLATGVFDNVVVEVPTTNNQAPTVTMTAPAIGAPFVAPASIGLAATASDTDGTITQVTFFNGATALSTDTSAPYAFTWNGVAAGSYSVTAVAQDNAGATTTSAARTVTVTAPLPNPPPVVTLTGPANGAVYTAPALIPITANASDANGTVTVVEFYNGTTMIGSDNTSPYSMSWNNVPAGTYALTALARDNAGAITVSGARDIRVDPAALPRTAIFTASTNHATAVDRYFLEIFPAGANPLVANPVATRDLGKPSVVGGEISVDVSTTTVALPPGSYIATVTAIGSGGSARSAASPTFVR